MIWDFHNYGGIIAIRDGKWKLVRYGNSGKNAPLRAWELYDMEADRSEQNNLAEKMPEKVNQLDTMFDRIAKQNSTEVEHRTGLLGSLLEPSMIIFIALVVGVILIAMYMPLFNMSARM